ncbi:Up-regulated during septation-domain-containing protein [Phyllosticta citricarpa]|uniref:Up-regulated during septation-domain-containing protein n=1 Tax=Phyllosticta citricarpa TaxID=55181 RepID=A0ABR1MMD9_9PEZI
MQRMSESQEFALSPPPPLNYGFPAPGTYTAASLDSPTLGGGSSVYSNGRSLPPPPRDVLQENYRSAVADAQPDNATPQQTKPRTSAALNLNDVVHVHLLVETAVGDSMGYDVLSIDEMEALKKERASLASRMEAVGQKLALESKVRDAAQSLNRLYSSKRRRGSSGSFEKLHSRNMSKASQTSNGQVNPDSLSKSESELAASAKKCDDLTRDLWAMERRAREIEMQLLRHTAGILQLTYKGPTKLGNNQQSLLQNISQAARPDSPASSYTYEHASARSPARIEDRNGFDERSFYRSPENLDRLVDALRNGKALPTKADSLGGATSEVDNETLQSVENRLEDLSDRLRQLIIRANPEANKEYDAAPKHSTEASPAERAANIAQKLDYLDQGLRDVEAEQSNMRQNLQEDKTLEAPPEQLELINKLLYQIVCASRQEYDEEYPAPPIGNGVQHQFSYMEGVISAIDQAQKALRAELSLASRGGGDSMNDAARYESVLQELWTTIVNGEEDYRQRKAQRRRMLEAEPEHNAAELDELSPDEDALPEKFSIHLFTSEVSHIYRKSQSLKEKNSILRRQIRQQRDLNEKSDAEKEEEFMRLRGEIERLRDALHSNSSDKEAIQEQEEAQRASQEQIAQLEERLEQALEQARASVADAQTQVAEAEAHVAELSASLEESQAAREQAERTAKEKSDELQQRERELRELEGDVVRLQTEVTVARAELDEAYGTRSQRAAANPEVEAQLEALSVKNVEMAEEVARLQQESAAAQLQMREVTDRERRLREELRDTITEFEELTRAHVETEKEREGLEGVIDGLREKAEQLEAQLNEEKMRWMGMGSPGAGSGGPVQDTTSTRVMRDEFKRMMREERAEAFKALRGEQEERKRLEQIIRALKREQLPTATRKPSLQTQNLTVA